MEKSRKKLPAGWEMKTLGEVCKLVRGPFGGSLKKENFVESGYAVYEQQHAINNQFSDIRYYIDDNKFAEMKRFELYPKDLIMSCSGTMGKVAIVPDNIEKGIINQALLKITANSQLNARYLKYYISSENFQTELAKYSQGVAIKNVASVPILKSTIIPIPSFPVQQRIVAKLDEAFAEIAAAKANIERNLQNCKEVFQCALTKELCSKKEGWQIKKLGEVCEKVEYGSSTKSKEQGSIAVLRMGNIQNGRFTFNNLVYSDNKEENQKYLLKYNDVLFNRTNSPELVGKTAIYKGEIPAIFAGYLIRIHRKETLLDADYLNYYLNSEMAKDYGKTVVISSVNQANINGTKLKEYPIPLPSLAEQQCIIKRLDAISLQCKQLEERYKQKLLSLEILKSCILQKAFSGEL